MVKQCTSRKQREKSAYNMIEKTWNCEKGKSMVSHNEIHYIKKEKTSIQSLLGRTVMQKALESSRV